MIIMRLWPIRQVVSIVGMIVGMMVSMIVSIAIAVIPGMIIFSASSVNRDGDL